MNDLLERYLQAVCSYFSFNKRNIVYDDLKEKITNSINNNNGDFESVIISYGHPLSVAYSYGYRPVVYHTFNKNIVVKTEKLLGSILGVYLFFSTVYYLYIFDCLPLFNNNNNITSISDNNISTWILSHPTYTFVFIILLGILFLVFNDFRDPTSQKRDLSWDLNKLYKLPSAKSYSDHSTITYMIIAFIIYFIFYTLVFSNPLILEIQHNTFKMIHLMFYFFEPFILMISFDCFIDMNKKVYTQRYLTYSIIINTFIFMALTVFIISSSFLDNYLLAFGFNIRYDFINILIVIGIILIYTIIVYKLYRNVIAYRSLFNKSIKGSQS